MLFLLLFVWSPNIDICMDFFDRNWFQIAVHLDSKSDFEMQTQSHVYQIWGNYWCILHKSIPVTSYRSSILEQSIRFISLLTILQWLSQNENWCSPDYEPLIKERIYKNMHCTRWLNTYHNLHCSLNIPQYRCCTWLLAPCNHHCNHLDTSSVKIPVM